ncbi:Cuticle protein 6 [Pseudolycoriella hygida]|uniref:Cuticle protein 6 n=1 Tax=Pseudolycoriella hygida TaxID=35572 RepID=A0A9Q0RYU1_9DIPT|nr:Cuticle protein 6 [Pseudolycoriella hygida]
MLRTTFFILFSLICVVMGQQYKQTTPVPILKQINRHNEDGSYSYGYEGGDGSFKIETKYPNGEVYGKYGYVDDTGKLREIEYGASRRGFEPAGSDINVPPPTVNNDNISPLGPNEIDDGQYREDPSIYYKDDKYNTKPVKTNNPSSFRLQNTIENNFPTQRTENYNQYQQLNFQPQSRFQLQQQQPQNFQQQTQFQPQSYQQTFEPRQYQQQQQQSYFPSSQADLFRGHPATQFDINTGSYSVSYTG